MTDDHDISCAKFMKFMSPMNLIIPRQDLIRCLANYPYFFLKMQIFIDLKIISSDETKEFRTPASARKRRQPLLPNCS